MFHPGRFVLAAVLTLTIAVHGIHAESEQPVVHLLAPLDSAMRQKDALVAETGLRLLAMDLAANHEIYAKYWPVDQQKDIPDTAYPRIMLGAIQPDRMPYLRLERSGNVFTVSTSLDGKSYICRGHYTTELPSKTHIGFYVHSQNTDEKLSAVVSGVRLNGAPFGDGATIGDLGECRQPGAVERNGDEWRIHTYGYDPDETHPNSESCEHGTFISVEHEGDFVLEAKVQELDTEELWAFAGLMCRAALTHDADTMGTYYKGNGWSGGMLRNSTYTSQKWIWDPGIHGISMSFHRSPEDVEELGHYLVSCACWDALSQSAMTVSLGLKKILFDRLDLNDAEEESATEGNSVASDYSGTLKEARSLALMVDEGSILAASLKVDSVLNETPQSAEAHYTAALCGSILACHDLYGSFHERARYLAGPFAHWLLAQGLAEAKRPEDMMSGAWVMLACGYPNAAFSVVQSLPADTQESSEARALKAFITRDYRQPETNQLIYAPPIEQLAWLWASQECDNDVALRTEPTRMATAHKSCAFLPMYDSPEVGPGHTSTVLGMALAYGTDTFTLLTDAGLPESDCEPIARNMANVWGLSSDDDARKIGSGVRAATIEFAEDDVLPGVITPLMELYAVACNQPVGPAPSDKGFVWRCLPAHDYADILRGRFLRVLYFRASFIGGSWGIPEYADEFCNDVANGIASMPNASTYFKSMGLRYLKRYEESRALCNRLIVRPFGRNPVVLRGISQLWDPPKSADADSNEMFIEYGRGCWDWSEFSWVANNYGYRYLRTGMLFACASIDDYSTTATHQLCWFAMSGPAKSTKPGTSLLERMPYNLALIRSLAREASRLDMSDLAMQMNEKLLVLAPDESDAYRRLAWLYKGQGKTREAIDVLEKAFENCEYTVGISNLMGRCAIWLVEEKRLAEALEIGEMAAQSYSYTGLHGLAYAQAANGMIDEAFQTYRAIAYRYDNGISNLLPFMFMNDFSDNEIMAEIESVTKIHEQMKDDIKKYVLTAFRRYGVNRGELFKKTIAGPLPMPNPKEAQREILYYNMCSRSFPEVVRTPDAMMSGDPRDLLIGDMAAIISGGETLNNEIKAFLKRHKPVNSKYEATLRLVIEGLSPEEALKESASDYDTLFTYLFIGIMAEKRGDLTAASEAYEKAAAVKLSVRAHDIATRWAAYLKDVESGKVEYVKPKVVKKDIHLYPPPPPTAKEKRIRILLWIVGVIGAIVLLNTGINIWRKRAKRVSQSQEERPSPEDF